MASALLFFHSRPWFVGAFCNSISNHPASVWFNAVEACFAMANAFFDGKENSVRTFIGEVIFNGARELRLEKFGPCQSLKAPSQFLRASRSGVPF